MARIRSVKPDFFRHEGLYEAEMSEELPLRVAFAGLWTAADREGRFRWAPRQLKLDCLPFDDVDFSRVLDALWTRGFVVKYEADGREFGFIPSWKDHQHINPREAASNLPEPNENNILTRDPRVDDASMTRHDLARGEGKGREGKGMEIPTREDASIDLAFETFKREYPSRGDASNPWKPAREKFCRAVKRGIDPEKIIAGASNYRKACERTAILGSEKVAQALTWINQERWEQYLSPTPVPTLVVDWERAVREYRETNSDRWSIKLGPEPGYGGCKAPKPILEKYGYTEPDLPLSVEERA